MCFTTIQAPDDTQIIFTFTQLNLELNGCHAELPNVTIHAIPTTA